MKLGLYSTVNRHPIACLWGWAMGCLLGDQLLIGFTGPYYLRSKCTSLFTVFLFILLVWEVVVSVRVQHINDELYSWLQAQLTLQEYNVFKLKKGKQIQCSGVTTWSIFSNKLTTDTHSVPVRARYGVSVVSLKSDLRSATVIAVLYVILWKIGQRYNGTRL